MESSESTQEEAREKYATLLNFHLRVPSRVYDVEGVTIFSKNRVEPPQVLYVKMQATEKAYNGKL